MYYRIQPEIKLCLSYLTIIHASDSVPWAIALGSQIHIYSLATSFKY